MFVATTDLRRLMSVEENGVWNNLTTKLILEATFCLPPFGTHQSSALVDKFR